MFKLLSSPFSLKHHIIFLFHLENQLKIPLTKMLVLLHIIKVWEYKKIFKM